MRSFYFYLILVLAFLYSLFVDAQPIHTYAGNGIIGYTDSGGVRQNAELNHPWGMVIDAGGNLFIADHINSAIRKINVAGVISTYAGTTTQGYGGDNGPATAAMMQRPAGLAVDAAGNLYIADGMDNRIRMVSAAGIITTIAGSGAVGYTGDGGAATAATFHDPLGIAIDATGNLYIADSGNNVIRKINTAGVISTIAGTGTAGYTGDGGAATAATLARPKGIAIDAAGNIFIAEEGNNVVRKITPAGGISTFAGSGVLGYSGDNGPATAAQFFTPNSIAFDSHGNVLISDENNNRVRRVSPDGIVATAAGRGSSGYSGDGGSALDAELYHPMGLAFDALGNLYVADYINSVVRIVNLPVTYYHAPTTTTKTSVTLYPDPADNTIQVAISTATATDIQIEVRDMLGRNWYTATVRDNKTQVDISGFPAGCYIVDCYSAGEQIPAVRFIKK